MTVLTLYGPDNSLQAWARTQALKELEEEDATFASYAGDAGLRGAMADKLRAQGKHPDRCGLGAVQGMRGGRGTREGGAEGAVQAGSAVSLCEGAGSNS